MLYDQLSRTKNKTGFQEHKIWLDNGLWFIAASTLSGHTYNSTYRILSIPKCQSSRLVAFVKERPFSKSVRRNLQFHHVQPNGKLCAENADT